MSTNKSYNKSNKSWTTQKPKTDQNKKRQKRNLRQCINKEIFDHLLNLIDITEINEHVKFNMKLLNLLLYYTGLRISEVLLLNKLNILELVNNGKLNVYCKKTNDFRTVFLMGQHKEKFKKHLGDMNLNDMHTKGIVNQYNNKLTERTAENWMNNYWDLLVNHFGGKTDTLKGRTFSFHSYRVNFINEVVRSSDLDKACKIIGHKDPCTTLIYFRRFKHDDKVYTDAIDDANF
jgi:site-specific recombinase XerD